MRDMHIAELKNEKRLPGVYRKGKKRADPPYYYPDDEDNETGCASVLVWRGRKESDGTVRVRKTQDKVTYRFYPCDVLFSYELETRC